VNLDAPDEEPVLLGMPHEGVTAMVGSAQSQTFWSGGRDGQINLWDLRTRTSEIHTDQCSVGGVTTLGLLDAGLVVGGQDGSVTLLSRRDLGYIARIAFGGGIRAMATVPGLRDSLVLANSQGDIILTNTFGTGAGEDRRWPSAHDGEIASVVVFQMAGQRFIASAGRDRKLHIWNYASNVPLQTIDLEGLPTSLSVYAPYLAVSTTSGVAVFALGKNQDVPGA
jgi:WD40 repeat protein